VKSALLGLTGEPSARLFFGREHLLVALRYRIGLDAPSTRICWRFHEGECTMHDERNLAWRIDFMRFQGTLIAAFIGFLPLVQLNAVQAKVYAQWVQLGPDGAASARAITDAACPAVVFDGVSVAMSVRSEPRQPFGNVKAAEFPVRGCEVAVPPGAVTAILEGRPLPLPKPNPRRILVFGDTGCRLLGAAAQNCNDPAEWPFAKIAAVAAAAQPDLVVHVGDYHYRENACPVARRGCEGSPFGYGFDAWNADFFEPAAPLLAAAPWVMVRGNHEDCARAGEGWFRFLDRAAMEATCRDLTGIFVARIGDFGVVVADGAAAADPRGDSRPMEELLRGQLAAVADKVPAEAWFVTHRPLNAMASYGGANPQDVIENRVLERALGPGMPQGVRMTVAGHIHLFQAVDFGGARAPQLVVGTGGDELHPEPMSAIGADINGQRVVNSVTRHGFGYMIWERSGAEWLGTLYGADAKALDRCRLVGRSLNCGQ
jgi:hypothetical protein